MPVAQIILRLIREKKERETRTRNGNEIERGTCTRKCHRSISQSTGSDPSFFSLTPQKITTAFLNFRSAQSNKSLFSETQSKMIVNQNSKPRLKAERESGEEDHTYLTETQRERMTARVESVRGVYIYNRVENEREVPQRGVNCNFTLLK